MGDVEDAVRDIVGEISQEVQRELEWLRDGSGRPKLATVEEHLQRIDDLFRRRLLEGASRVLGNGYRGSQILCGCKSWMKYMNDREKTILTILGPMTLSRSYYWCENCHTGRAPLDEELGIVEEGQSHGVQMATALLCALLPNEKAMQVFEELHVPHVSEKESQRVTLAVGERAMAAYEAEAKAFAEDHVAPSLDVRAQVPERLAVLMDGTTVHTDGSYHEAKVGAFYAFDEEGNATGQKTYATSFRGVDDFRDLWDAEAQRWHLADAQDVAALCDGAIWTWRTVEERCPPHTVQILDFYHGTEHLGTLAKTIWGEGSAKVKPWVEAQETRLLEGDEDDFFQELRQWTTEGHWEEEGKKQLAYFEANRDRIHYKEYLARGYPIGSGVVESGCKVIVGLREKQPGMRWRSHTAEAIAHLRAIYYSGRWPALRRRLAERAAKAG
jgi:hypothetical protein